MDKRIALLVVNLALIVGNVGAFFYLKDKHSRRHAERPPVVQVQPPVNPQPVQPTPPPEVKPKISFTIPNGDMSFQAIRTQLQTWAKEAPSIVEYGTYGKSQNGTEHPYIRVGKKTGPKVLIHACIHGNEHLSAMVAMGVFGKMLDAYMVDPEVTKLFSERDIYFVPVFSVESFQRNSRHDMGKDPNRNWSDARNNDVPSIPSVQSMKDFFKANQFKAVMSCHNYGKVYLYPWGYVQQKTPHDAAYRSILGEMASVTGYKYEQLLRQSAPPYYGYEADWYYKNGALAFVNEIGTRFEATGPEIRTEVEKNYKAFMIFINKAPVAMR
jgi:predicted deacylase